MTSLSENKPENEVNIGSRQYATDNEQPFLQGNQAESTTSVADSSIINDRTQEDASATKDSANSIVATGEDNVGHENNHDAAFTHPSPPIVTVDGERVNEATEPTVNADEDENRSRRSFHPKVKYSPMSHYRSSYGIDSHLYGPPPPPPPSPYYYYSLPSLEKPAPLMFVSTQQQSSPSSTSPSRDNQTGSSTTISPPNLPPRLRQTSAAETESPFQAPPTTSPQPPATTNGRRHRSILPRGLSTYYSPHPPPLMATPPGVLYPYPPAVHPPGHIAYNIRPPDEYELYAFQQQLMNLPPQSVIWSSTPNALSPHGHPSFAPYALNGLPPGYVFNPPTVSSPTSSFLNPDAAEWVPAQNGHDSASSSDEQILIDDEVNFPPLNSTANSTQAAPSKDHPEGSSEQIETPPEVISSDDKQAIETPSLLADNSNVSTSSKPKIDSPNSSSSSQEDNNKPLSPSPIKVAPPVTYSTIISQTSDNQKPNKINPNSRQQPTPSANHVHNQLPPRERANKQAQPQQRPQVNAPSTSHGNSRRRQPFNNKNTRTVTRNLPPADVNSLSKPPAPVADDWIEVKSKKTKKFDRSFNDSSTEKFLLDEQIHKSVSPSLSLTSTGDNTTTTFTSEDDFDEKDNQDLVIDMDNEVANDYNQIIIDEIHNRLDNNEQLLIIMRGCPGSGKSTLAKSLNQGYNGVILSTDDYFIDRNLNKYVFDLNQLDDAHRYNRRRASDALKRDVSPIIIDNTNTQVWEMKPYVAMGIEAGYDILLVEPQTPWRYKARELFKRNRHNLPLRRIRDMLNRFERNVTVQTIIDQLASAKKPTNILSAELDNRNREPEIVDPVLTPKKLYDIIDDSLILDDVRLCINDMIWLLTSNFYQTALLSSALTLPITTTTTATSPTSTPLSVSFHDLSLIPSPTASLPSTPSTPHSRFHRTVTRFSSATGQDHSFSTEHILRSSTAVTTLSRCLDPVPLTPPLSAQSSLIAKKRRKNKSKQPANELVLNTNNNNNNDVIITETVLHTQQSTFRVVLPDDDADFMVIDERNDNGNDSAAFQCGLSRDSSSATPDQEDKQSLAQAQLTTHHGIHDGASSSIHRASERLSQRTLTQFYQTRQLALHGLHSDEALNVLKQLEIDLNEKSPRTAPQPLEIITDPGSVRSVILTHLQQRNYTYSEGNHGVILLQLPNARN